MRRLLLVLVPLLLVGGGCSSQSPPVAPSPATTASVVPSPSRMPPAADPTIGRIPDQQWRSMQRAAVVRQGCPMTRQDLRRVDVNFHTFTGEVKRGALVVNRDVAQQVARIFTDIFDSGFPIRKMRPIERYAGDDNASMADDNTSAYNCRSAAQANSNAYDSPHANGRAIDINPRENPWWDPRCQCFMPDARFAPRTRGKGKILRGGIVWRAFTRRGWIWQDLPTPDYQHFDTGYPSRPR